ncbi:MAG: TetR/AcrR family transcriptional regulator, partial [Paracoccaceae bacterium]
MTAGKGQTEVRRRLSPDERRAQIVTGAVGYFAEVGLDGNTRELSKRLGVTQSLIFNYFSTKSDLIEAVYHTVYLDRLSPTWPVLITDRSQSLRDRTVTFYNEYAKAIFTYEWMRIFMFSGLAGTTLNGRYLDHLSEFVLRPLLGELRAANPGLPPEMQPDMEDVWTLHGGI